MPGQREDRPGRPVHQRAARRVPARQEGRDRHEDRRRLAARRSPSSCWRSASCATGRRSSRCRRPAASSSTCSLTELIALLPVGPPLYPDDAVTDEALEDRIAELIREAALEGVSDELPHSIAVTIDDIVERDDKDLRRDLREPLRRARQPEGHHHRPQGRAAAGGRRAGARADRAAGRQAGVPVAAGQGRQGLAARPEAARPARLLASSPLDRVRCVSSGPG